MPSFEPENKIYTCDLKDAFGGSMDYFLFGVNSSADFAHAMDFFIKNFHANMVRIEDFSIEGHPLNARFPMAYALFDRSKFADDQPESVVDFLSVVLFQNRASSYDKPKSVNTSDTLDMFADAPEAEGNDVPCFALNRQGISIQDWAFTDVDYLVFISSEKNCDASEFANYFNEFSISKANLTSFIRNDVPQLSPKIMPQIYFLRSIVAYAQCEIAKDLEFSDLCAHRRSVIQADKKINIKL